MLELGCRWVELRNHLVNTGPTERTHNRSGMDLNAAGKKAFIRAFYR